MDKSRSRLVLETAGLLLLCAGGYAWFAARGVRDPSTGWAILMIVPISSALAFAFIGLIVPSLFALGRIGFPLNFTLPLVYGVILRTSATLWGHGSNPLVRFQTLIDATGIWRTWTATIVLLLSQVLILSLRSRLGVKRPPSE